MAASTLSGGGAKRKNR